MAASCVVYSSVVRSPPMSLRPAFRGLDRLDAHARRHVLGAMLIERRRGDAVRKPLHHQRPIGDRRKDARRDLA